MLRKSASILTFMVIAGAAVSSSWAQSWPQSDNCDNCPDNCSDDYGHQHGDHLHELSAKIDLAKKQAHLIERRNNAWPKPFQCKDRQAYHCIFNTMLMRGFQVECTFTSDHFVPETNELNSAGIAKIAGIMNNLPESQRSFHIYQTNDFDAAQARLLAVQNQVRAEYGHLATPTFAMTTTRPHGMQGNMVEQTMKQFIEAQPTPAVPASTNAGIAGQ